MSELQERLIALSERGAPRGFDAVFEAAARDASVATVEGDRNEDEPDGTADLDAIDDSDDNAAVPVVALEDERKRRRRPFMSMIAAAGLSMMLLVGVLVAGSVVGNGGAGSPEGAVRKLADAISNEDPIEAADVLAPSEVGPLHHTIDAAERRAAELRLVQQASAPLSGVDLNVDNLGLSTENLADGYVKVKVDSGVISAQTQKAKFSPLMQKALHDSQDNSASFDLAQAWKDQDTNLGAFVVAVRENGNWYVSAAYTVLEYIREYNHLPAADFGSGKRDIAQLGADSPDAAVQDTVRAAAARDWTKLIALAPPQEIPVYDYRAALTQLAQQQADNGGSTGPIGAISELSTDVEMHGDTAKVTVHLKGSNDNGPVTWDGGCWTQNELQQCVGATYMRGFMQPSGAFTQSHDAGPTQVTVVKRDGRWFVSPVGTALDILDTWIANIDRRELYTMLNLPGEIDPDARVTLGAQIPVDNTTPQPLVLGFTGHKGEKLLGLVKQPKSDGSVWAFGEVFGSGDTAVADGSLFEGDDVTLPADGDYRIVVRGALPGSTITIWDAADAPKEARSPYGSVTPPFGSACGVLEPGPDNASNSQSAVTVPTVGNDQMCYGNVPSDSATGSSSYSDCRSVGVGGTDCSITAVAVPTSVPSK